MFEIEFSHMGKNNGNPDLVCENIMPVEILVALFLSINMSH